MQNLAELGKACGELFEVSRIRSAEGGFSRIYAENDFGEFSTDFKNSKSSEYGIESVSF
jgi:hypothetical protein